MPTQIYMFIVLKMWMKIALLLPWAIFIGMDVGLPYSSVNICEIRRCAIFV